MEMSIPQYPPAVNPASLTPTAPVIDEATATLGQ